MVLTFKQLVDQVLNYLDQAGETGTTFRVVADTIRRVHRARLAERRWNFMLWDEPATLVTVPGQRFYSLHPAFFRPMWVFNATTRRTMEQATSGNLLPQMSGIEVDYDTGFGVGDFTSNFGSAYRFFLGGVTQVAAQPSGPSVLTVAGQSDRTVTVRGEAEDGITEETLTVGTPGSIEFSKVLQVTKGEGWTSTMTLSAGATTILKLLPNEFGRQYRTLELLATPTISETLKYKFYRTPTLLESDNSIPDLPAPFSELLVYDALVQLGTYNKTLDKHVQGHWRAEQYRLEQGLIEFDAGPDALGASIEYQSYIPRD